MIDQPNTDMHFERVRTPATYAERAHLHRFTEAAIKAHDRQKSKASWDNERREVIAEQLLSRALQDIDAGRIK